MLTNEQKRQLGARPELIPLQEKVRTDIYNILKKLGCDPQTPDCVGISTENGIHRIAYYPFNVEKIWGYYKYHLPYLMVKTDYKLKDLKKMIKTIRNCPNITFIDFGEKISSHLIANIEECE